MFKKTFSILLLALSFSGALQAQEHKLLYKFAEQLDHIERRFWRIAPLPEEHRERPEFSTRLSELENTARELRHSCIKYEDGAIPELRGDVAMLNRVLFQFKVDSKAKSRRISNLQMTGLKSYAPCHHRLIREKAKESGEKLKKTSTKLPPKLSAIDIENYNEFLDEITDKNIRRFTSWANQLDSRARIQNAEEIFAVYQKTICDMRLKLVKMAKYAAFKEEKKK